MSASASAQKPVRVLVVDDSAVVRKLIVAALSRRAEIQVVGEAGDGRAALDLVKRLDPEVVTLDVEMPLLDGLSTLSAIKRQYPLVHVIMFSSVTERGASATLKALALGAVDFVTKPSSTGGGGEAALVRLSVELVDKVLAAGKRRRGITGTLLVAELAKAAPPPEPKAPARVDIVAIAASTGGPVAVGQVLAALPASFPAPILVVQHMPATFTKIFANQLQLRCKLKVQEAVKDAVARPGEVWIAPGDAHLVVRRNKGYAELDLSDSAAENGCRPAADVLLRSLARVYGPAALAIVLTGMGQDGLRGAQAMRAAGGDVWAQDEATSVVWGMPGAVTLANQASRVLPLGRVSAELYARVSARGSARVAQGGTR